MNIRTFSGLEQWLNAISEANPKKSFSFLFRDDIKGYSKIVLIDVEIAKILIGDFVFFFLISHHKTQEDFSPVFYNLFRVIVLRFVLS